ncbi:hypothetical protein AB4K20DRAFT_1894560 [Rhizopus microsporus]
MTYFFPHSFASCGLSFIIILLLKLSFLSISFGLVLVPFPYYSVSFASFLPFFPFVLKRVFRFHVLFCSGPGGTKFYSFNAPIVVFYFL